MEKILTYFIVICTVLVLLPALIHLCVRAAVLAYYGTKQDLDRTPEESKKGG